MSRCLRLSMAELAKLSGKRQVLSEFLPTKPQNRRAAARISRAVSTATPCVRRGDAQIELAFAGARLATLNDLLAMSVQERGQYRRAWHKLIRDAAIAEFDGRPPTLQAVEITIVRHGPREIDPDAIIPKAPIDGLRYAAFIPDDTKRVVRKLTLAQARGDYAVVIALSAWQDEAN